MLCKTCNTDKPDKAFYVRRSRTRCRECTYANQKAYRAANSDKLEAAGKAYRADPERRAKAAARCKQWYLDNTAKHRETSTRWREQNPDRDQELKRNWYQRNRDRILAERRPRLPGEFSRYARERKAHDIQYKLTCHLRSRISKAVTSESKSGSAVRDVGCTISELRQHLEAKFQPGMSWDNYGIYGWHIDHIIPLSKFDLSIREEFLKACHYTNLQPLWAADNLKKGNRTV